MGVRALKRLIVLSVLVGACVSAGELKIILKPEDATPRINYAVEQVRAACKAVSAKGTVLVRVQGVGKTDNLNP